MSQVTDENLATLIEDLEGETGTIPTSVVLLRSMAIELQRLRALTPAGGGEVVDTPHTDDIVAGSLLYQCAECVREEREFCAHTVDRVAVVNNEVVCLDCIAEFYPKARTKKAADIAVKLKRQRMVIAAANKSLAALKAPPAAPSKVVEALKAVEADAVSIGSGQSAISDTTRAMVEAALAGVPATEKVPMLDRIINVLNMAQPHTLEFDAESGGYYETDLSREVSAIVAALGEAP